MALGILNLILIIGLKEGWFKGTKFDKKIIVPFPWGSKLSKVKDEANIGWYYRKINIQKTGDQKEHL